MRAGEQTVVEKGNCTSHMDVKKGIVGELREGKE